MFQSVAMWCKCGSTSDPYLLGGGVRFRIHALVPLQGNVVHCLRIHCHTYWFKWRGNTLRERSDSYSGPN